MLEIPALAEAPAAALRLAVKELPPGCPLTTSRVLAALARTDPSADWQRIWLHTGDPLGEGLAEAPDALGGSPPQSLKGVLLSGRLADSLRLLRQISAAYRMTPAPSGALAVALLADPESGAACALLRAGSLSHGELLELAQSELLGTRLDGLDGLIAQDRATVKPGAAAAGQGVPPSARSATAASGASAGDGRGVRIRVLGWRALSCLALGLTLMAVFWHRTVIPPPTAIELPPYPVPAVAAHLLTTGDLPSTAGGGWLQDQDGPPDTGLFTGTGRYRADLRRETVIGAWQRTWGTADAQNVVSIRAIELRQRAYAAGFLGDCTPTVRFPVPLADQSGYLTRSPSPAQACAQALRGRTLITIVVESSRQKADQDARRVLVDIARRLLPDVSAAAHDLPPVSITDSPTRIAILDAYMGLAVGVPLLLGLVNLLRDRSAWRRLRSRLARSRRRGTFSIASLAAPQLARYGALTLVRVAVIAWTMRLTERTSFGTWQTLFTVGAAIAGILAVEWVIRRLRPAPSAWRPPIFHGWRWLLAASSLVLTAAVAGAGILLIVAGIDYATIDTNPTGGSDYFVGQLGLRLEVGGVLLIFAAILPFTFARRLGMRALRQQAKDPARDGLPPVLMLRSFADDARLLRVRRLDRASIVERLCLRKYERFEEVAADALAVYGPVYALSRVGEKLPPALGAERRSFAMADWQDRVRELIDSARLISVTVGRSRSLLWEIGEIRAAGALARTIFLLPPTSQREQRKRLVVLADALKVDFAVLDQVDAGQNVLAVTFPDGSGPVVITGGAPDEMGYENAITVWAIAVTGAADGYPADIQRAAVGYAQYAAGAGWRAARSASGRTAPKYKVYAPGKAPVYRPLWRQTLRWRWWYSLTGVGALVAAVFRVVIGSTPSATVSARFPVGLLVQDQASQAVYGAFGQHAIQRIDFTNASRYQGIYVKDPMSGLVVDGTAGYYASAATGRVGRVDLVTGHVAWVRYVGLGVRPPVLIGDQLAVVSPALGAVLDLAVSDGQVLARRGLPGTPYGIAAADGRLFVSLVRRDQVTELAPHTLATVATTSVPRGPWDVVAQGNRVWVSSVLAHVLTPLGPRLPAGPTAFWMSVQAGEVVANGGWLAIQGMEWVTRVSPAGQVTRIPLSLPNIDSLLILGDGKVIVGYQSGEIDQLG